MLDYYATSDYEKIDTWVKGTNVNEYKEGFSHKTIISLNIMPVLSVFFFVNRIYRILCVFLTRTKQGSYDRF